MKISERVAEREAARAQCAKIEEKQSEIKQKISNEEHKLQGLKANFEESKKRKEMKDAENKETLIALEK